MIHFYTNKLLDREEIYHECYSHLLIFHDLLNLYHLPKPDVRLSSFVLKRTIIWPMNNTDMRWIKALINLKTH